MMPDFDKLFDEYARLWDSANILSEKAQGIETSVQALAGLKTTYDQIAAATLMPWFVVGLIHYRESNFKMNSHLHNGDPLTGRTTNEPIGHPKAGSPPFTWVESAIDALTIKGLDKVDNWTIERIAYELERYNGWGYRAFRINSPYLWSFTDQYTTGYFIADHVFDPTKPNDQAGAMALLKKLIADNIVEVTRQTGVAVVPPPPPVPVPTGLYEADGSAFSLTDAPNDNATRGFHVLVGMPIVKLKEVNSVWWQVEVTDPAGNKHAGFAKQAWLKERTVLSTFAPDQFALACLSDARIQGTSAHFLIALSQAESAMQNVAAPGGGFGPFAMTEDEWSTYNSPATGFSDTDRFDPISQTTVCAAMLVKLTAQLKLVLQHNRLPTGEELYLARVFGVKSVIPLTTGDQGSSVRSALHDILTVSELDRIAAARPALLTNTITVQAMRAEATHRLDAGFDRAVSIISKVEPDYVLGPAMATDGTNVPWMKIAEGELGTTAAHNPERITEYFTATTLGAKPPTTPWCAAFVSWCVKKAGSTLPPNAYSAAAANWLDNGEKLSGPQYGAVAVLKPLVQGDTGHVGFVSSWDADSVTLLGGNQSNSVCKKPFQIADVLGWRMMPIDSGHGAAISG